MSDGIFGQRFGLAVKADLPMTPPDGRFSLWQEVNQRLCRIGKLFLSALTPSTFLGAGTLNRYYKQSRNGKNRYAKYNLEFFQGEWTLTWVERADCGRYPCRAQASKTSPVRGAATCPPMASTSANTAIARLEPSAPLA